MCWTGPSWLEWRTEVANARRRGGCDDNDRGMQRQRAVCGMLLSCNICRKDDRPASKAPQARRRMTTEMNDDDKDDNHWSLLLQIGNRSKQTRREHKETTMDMRTTIKQITRRGGDSR